MDQFSFSTRDGRDATTKKQRPSNRAIRRALRQFILGLREMELAEFAKNAQSPLGIRTASLRTELVRVEMALPLRPGSIARVLTGLQLIVPLRPAQPLQHQEVSSA